VVFKNVMIGDVRRTLADALPEDLKKLREDYESPVTGKKGLTQSELANALGLSVISIKKYESGEVAPSIEVLTKMSELYDVDFLISHRTKHPLIEKKLEVELPD